MRRLILPALVIAAAGVLSQNSTGSANGGDTPPTKPIVVPLMPLWMDRACRTEDSWNCVWDVRLHGGDGHSFMVREFPHRVCWMFFEENQHDYCVSKARLRTGS